MLPFIATNNHIYEVLETWPSEWCTLDKAVLERMVVQQRKKELQQRLTHLAEKTHQGQQAASWKEVTKEVIAEETTKDQEMASEQDMQQEKEIQECTDHLTKSTKIK